MDRGNFPTSLLPDLALIHDQSTITTSRSLAYPYWSPDCLNTIFHIREHDGLKCIFSVSEKAGCRTVSDWRPKRSSVITDHVSQKSVMSSYVQTEPKLQSLRLTICNGLHAYRNAAGIEERRASKSQPTGQQKTTCFVVVTKYWSRQDPRAWKRPHSHLPPGYFTKADPAQRNVLAEI